MFVQLKNLMKQSARNVQVRKRPGANRSRIKTIGTPGVSTTKFNYPDIRKFSLAVLYFGIARFGMGRVRKKRKGAKYNYDKNRRKEWKKAKKLPTIGCTQIKEAWDPKKSVKKNLEEMGISADPNQTFKIPKTKDIFISEDSKTDEEEKTRKRQPKEHVIEDLEMEASIPQEKTLKLSSEEVKYCIYMLEKYGEDYKAMARDKRNHFQDTPKQIKKKIKTFMNIPEQYNAYIASKTSILC